MSEKTAKCPYCNSTDLVLRYEESGHFNVYYIRCQNCLATAPPSFNPTQARHNVHIRNGKIPEEV